jgi:hypothetical protein
MKIPLQMPVIAQAIRKTKKVWLKDPKTKKPSVTLTLMVVGFMLAAVKMFISGMTISSFTLDKFSGTDFAAAVGALGIVYAWRKQMDK